MEEKKLSDRDRAAMKCGAVMAATLIDDVLGTNVMSVIIKDHMWRELESPERSTELAKLVDTAVLARIAMDVLPEKSLDEICTSANPPAALEKIMSEEAQ